MKIPNKKPMLLFLSSFIVLLAVRSPGKDVHGEPLLKVLDINVWSGLDYIGTLTMGAYESDAVREKRYQALLNGSTPGCTWDPATNLNQQEHYLDDDPTDQVDLITAIQALDKTLPSRIDCIFTGPRTAVDSGQIIVKSSRVVMKQIIDGVHASDHDGIYTELLINRP